MIPCAIAPRFFVTRIATFRLRLARTCPTIAHGWRDPNRDAAELVQRSLTMRDSPSSVDDWINLSACVTAMLRQTWAPLARVR
jgi:hypothetical protein